MSDSYLKIIELDKFFGDFAALKNISLDINEGEFVCFLGPSGCGKTTLLRAIAGLDIQSNGRIIQDGKDVSWLSPDSRDFGIVFQSYALFPNLSVADNIAYGLRNRKVKRVDQKERVKELLDIIGLPDSGSKFPGQLSGGQQQRVALARAIATSPGLLLLDEPLSALDARVRHHLRHEIKELQRKLGVTTVMVTHDQEEALSMADRIVVMNHGVIEQVGTPEEIYSYPKTPFVAQFVGTMNFVPCSVVDKGTINVGGNSVCCPQAASMIDQTGVSLAIRPEDIRIRNTEQADNRLLAQVTSMEFLGSFVRSKLSVEGMNDLIIADFSMNDIRDFNISHGDQLALDLPEERLHLFAGEVL
ncbi:putative 2-aminoethylphosphonate ABC transporter ATP-binding protein [Neptuniibacter sp. 1_MG-2023]|uniref:putative 2-aminoethylphosphonate ABC transporter ATP-binding protein n=1 Tax=Neptuniibacter sp. 1_MG-2023 TaxID=3062662 RepID=UPI0026E3C5C9|nr:putative 2-aminoethylphosphonate ABC transporter ATP-binding protein [Neptuniibacter sp. 1_MG-2023]MDO6593716.1 putative 2-aminoethylphosphonate ABC transporter ATP-binding protein [Neptuniibacter sp. 1_MG-2023]